MFKKFLLVAVALALMSGVSHGALGLVHHYNFEDGTTKDSIGGVDGVLVNGATVSGGKLVLVGDDDYMSMDGSAIAINTFDEVTIEAWYIPSGNVNNWTMLAAFGDTQGGLGVDGFFMTSARWDDKSRAAISCGEYSTPWADEDGSDGPEIDDPALHHMVATLDATTITLWIDGVKYPSATLTGDNQISNISQMYAYLGNSIYSGDIAWHGAIDEFNIYNKALPDCVIQFAYAAGPYVPEPTTLALLGFGSLVLFRRRKS